MKIALIGPESSGKTTLCMQLASVFDAPWIPEFARIYLTDLGRPYVKDDVETIARQQLKNEAEAVANHPLVFCDTEIINFKVWLEHAFGACPAWIDSEVLNSPCDLYLLTSPDLPWQFDPLRENPGKGEFFFDWYKHILDALKRKYVVIGGSPEERLNKAIAAVEKLTGSSRAKK